MTPFRDWPRARKWLILSLSGLVVVLFAVYFIEAYLRVKSGTALVTVVKGDSADVISEPPIDDTVAEDGPSVGESLLRELEAGRNNRQPAPLGFLFRQAGANENPEEHCGGGCLDQAVAPELVFFLMSPEGQMCRGRTRAAFLWKSEGYEFPATAVVLDKACEKIPDAEIVVFAMERPQFAALRLLQPPDPGSETKESLEKLAPLHAKILAASEEAEGMAPLTGGFLPITPQETVLSVAEGPLKIRVHRWLEGVAGTAADQALLRTGLLESQVGDRPARRLGYDSLLCGEIPMAFRLNGELYLLIEQYACGAGVRCRSFQQWRDGTFEPVYGSCRFST